MRFVVLEHRHNGVHYDLMLERAGTLRTWRLAAPPTPGAWPAEASFDHRLLYLDYEGPVSGDRGHVARWDGGTYVGSAEGDRVEVRLDGARLRGTLTLVRGGGERWEGAFTPT